MIAQSLLLGFFLSSIAAQFTSFLFNETDIDDGSRYVKPLLDPEIIAKNETIIVVSFLAAISQVSQEIGNVIREIISTGSKATSSDSSSAFDSKHASTMGNLHSCFRTDFDGSKIAGALKVAVDDINERKDILPNHVLHYLFKNTCGDEQISTQAFMDHWKMGARVFIGPESNCRTEAQMAAAQNLPIISYKCRDKVVSDKRKYTTFARTAPAETDITRAFITLMKQFNWHKFSVIYESTTQANKELMDALKEAVENENKNAFDGGGTLFHITNVSELHQFSEIGTDATVDAIIEHTKKISRIFVSFGSVRLFRRILQTMGQKGMMEDQKYMLLYLDADYNWLDVYDAMNNHFVRNTMVSLRTSWDNKNSSDSLAVKYLKNAIAIIPTPVDYTSEKFVKFWNRSTQHLNAFGVTKDKDHRWSVRYNRFACYLYDAVMIYAKALHELIESSDVFDPRGVKYDPTRDGQEITKKIAGSYESICGFTMTINENHDAKGNYSMISWQAVLNRTDSNSTDYYPHNFALDITGVFIEDENGTPKIKFNRPMMWDNDEIPRDQPECGFNEELCTGATVSVAYATFFVVFAFTLVGACLGAGCSYKTRRVEKELHSIWKIDPKEIHYHTKESGVINGSIVNLLADNRDFWDQSNYEDEDVNLRRDTGIYRGSNVWIKQLIYEKKAKEFTRRMKIEMRVMRQLNQNNVNPFLGIFSRGNTICVVRDYCARGSLMDLLQNKDMRCDDIFITSFIDDLVRGMAYLHESQLGVHGNLKSTNCLITTRWVLQVADFGLMEVREGRKWESEKARWESMLWTAPELLKQSNFGEIAFNPTKSSDVYSFGVILHEVSLRCGPYNCMLPNSPEVSEIVKSAAEGAYPHIGHDVSISRAVVDTIKSCYKKAAERPDFKYGIRNLLRVHFQQQKKKNIMDHMFEMMDNYQSVLEERISERTKELQAEQQRSENLLSRMLPPAVSQQLLQGEGVTPELYPGVTIYFSDIVGFTRISGESEPIQIVRFLNKLYTLFDDIIKQYQVYKVETIGDAYMVVSGVPKFNCRRVHAEQIAVMALHLLEAVKNFTIPHLPKEKLLLRIGMHTGQCVGGIVGSAMPRFCLFGDSVNTASRMESNGEPLKIHISQETKSVLENSLVVPPFYLEKRGKLSIKGKGEMTTYWLLGRQGLHFDPIADPPTVEEMGIPDLFTRVPKQQSATRGSSWGINRDSTLSLVKDFSFMRKHDKPPPQPLKMTSTGFQDPAAVMFSAQNGGHVSVGGSYRELISVNEEAPCVFERGRDIRRQLHAQGAKDPPTEETVLRKRSSSLPECEKMNMIGEMAKAADSHSLHSGSPSPSQYPSYLDIEGEVKRKRGMEMTVWPCRKRSLSVGDTGPDYIEGKKKKKELRQLLLEDDRRKARKIEKDKKSVLSLSSSIFRDSSPLTRIRDASPFRSRNFWQPRSNDRPRGDSLNRFFKRLTKNGTEYTGLAEYTDSTDGSDEQMSNCPVNSTESFSFGRNDRNKEYKEPLIPTAPELMV